MENNNTNNVVIINNNNNDYKTVCLLALIFGISGFLINPLYLVSIAAIVLGIVGQIHTVY